LYETIPVYALHHFRISVLNSSPLCPDCTSCRFLAVFTAKILNTFHFIRADRPAHLVLVDLIAITIFDATNYEAPYDAVFSDVLRLDSPLGQNVLSPAAFSDSQSSESPRVTTTQ
jgi:hypothetical protein